MHDPARELKLLRTAYGQGYAAYKAVQADEEYSAVRKRVLKQDCECHYGE
jgi:hypothetical protein